MSKTCRWTARPTSTSRAAASDEQPAAAVARRRKLLRASARLRRRAPHGSTIRSSSGRRHAHVQLVARELLDARVRGPGALLELQLAPFDIRARRARAVSACSSTKSLRASCLRVDDARPPTRAPRATSSGDQRSGASARCSCVEPLGDAQHGAARARIARDFARRRACRAADEPQRRRARCRGTSRQAARGRVAAASARA